MPASEIQAGGAAFRLRLDDQLTPKLNAALADVTKSIAATTAAINLELKAVQATIKGVGEAVRNVGIQAAAAGAAVSTGLVGATIQAGKLETVVDKFESVFGNQAAAVRKWAIDFKKAVGSSEKSILAFLSGAQDTLVPIGIDPTAATKMSKQIVTLAADLAAFNEGVTVADAVRDIQSALTGSTETLKKFGIIATEAAVAQRLVSEGIDPSGATQAQKAIARLNIALEASTAAQGAARRNANRLDGALVSMREAMSELVVEIGKPFREALTSAIKAITAAIRSATEFLKANPAITKAVGAAAIAVTGVGSVAAAVGATLAKFAGSIALGVAGLRLLGFAGGRAVGPLNAIAVAIGGVIKRIGAMLSLPAIGAFLKGAVGLVTRAISVAFRNLGAGAAAAFALIRGGLATISRIVVGLGVRMAAALLNPWVAVAVAIEAARFALLRYYRNQQELEQKRGDALERRRQEIVAQSFRDAGQDVPVDLSKTLNVENARVIPNLNRQSVDANFGKALTNAQSAIALEILSFASPLKALRQRLEDASRLLETGRISREQFDAFAKREVDKFRASEPRLQRREALAEELRTPTERLAVAIDEARELFGNDPVMFRRAVDAAREQFRASDKAAQLAKQFQTPLEAFRAAVVEARTVFANDPENRQRAIDAAEEQFRLTDPVAQLRESLRTPSEEFQARMAHVADILKGVPEGIRKALFERARAQAVERFKAADPDQQAAKRIREALKTGAQRVAEKIREAIELAQKGLLTTAEVQDFIRKAREEFVGKDSGPDLLGLATTSAQLASNVGAFAPTFDRDREDVEQAKKQTALQEAMEQHLKEINQKEALFE